MRLSHIIRFAAIGSLGLLSACASLSANIDSDFSCRAPKGRCAPTSAIDAEAFEANDGQQIGNALRPTVTHGVLPSAKAAARTTENILKIVLPAHVDRAGYLRDEAAVYVVITKPRWASEQRSVTAHSAKDTARSISRANRREEDAVVNPDTPKVPTLSAADFAGGNDAADLAPETMLNSIPHISSSREGSPLTLREAIAGASLPAIEGFAGIPPARTPHAISIGDNAPSGIPNAAAIEAARLGHRIGDGSQGATVAESESVSAVVNQAKSQGQSNAKRGRPARAANKFEQTPPPPAELDVVTSPDMPVSHTLEPRL